MSHKGFNPVLKLSIQLSKVYVLPFYQPDLSPKYPPTLAIQDAVVLKSVSLIMYELSPPQKLYEKLCVKIV